MGTKIKGEFIFMKKITQMVTLAIVLAVVIILIYDAYAISQGGTEASISSQLIVLSYKQPLVPSLISWFIGLLMGHLFWRMKGNNDTRALGLDEKHEQK
jgi:hypothetical protein